MRTLKSASQELLATIDGKAVYMSNLQGEIYKQFPVEHFKNSTFREDVEFPGDFVKAKDAFNARVQEQKVAKEAATAAKLKLWEEKARKEYEARRYNVLLLRKLRNDVQVHGAGTVYCVSIEYFAETADDWNRESFEFTLYATEQEARMKFLSNKNNLSAEFGKNIEMKLLKSDFDNEVLQLTSYDDFREEYQNRHLDDEEIDRYEFAYTYRDITGDIVMQWSWEKHVGYCRNLEEIVYGCNYGRTERDLITGNEDSVCRPNCEIIITAEELQGMSKEDIREELINRLSDSRYRWYNFQPGVESRVDEFIARNF